MSTRVCVIGPTGVGKSAFCNLLCGKAEGTNTAFPVSASINSCTYLTTAQTERWFGNEEAFTLIDTPGLGDADGRDTQHIASMVKELKQLNYVNAFMVVFNSQNPRMDEHLRAMLDIFSSIFSNDFFTNVVLVFTRWEHNKKAERKRGRSGESRESREREFNAYFKEHFHIKHTLPAVFVDNYPDRDDDEELRATMVELKTLQLYTNKLPPFKCEDAQAVRGHLDQLKSDIKEERKQHLAAAADALAKAEEAKQERKMREDDKEKHQKAMSEQEKQHSKAMGNMRKQIAENEKNWQSIRENMQKGGNSNPGLSVSLNFNL